MCQYNVDYEKKTFQTLLDKTQKLKGSPQKICNQEMSRLCLYRKEIASVTKAMVLLIQLK